MRASLLAAFMFVLCPTLAQAVSVSLAPSEVTVFTQGARVLATGQAQLPAGTASLVFEGLPASLDDNSLSLAVKGPAGTKLVSMQVRQVYTPETAQARQRELEKKIADLREQRAGLDDAQTARAAEMDLLKSLGKQGAEQGGARALTQPQALADFTAQAAKVGKRLADLLAATRRDKRAQADLDKQIEALQRELNGQGPGQRQNRAVEAELDLATAGQVELSLAYHVGDAGWTPIYDVRLEDSADPSVRLAFSGQVRQASGQDWDQVKLTLSTARPNAGSQVPDPTNWWLDFYSQPRYRPMRFAAKAMVESEAMAPAPGANGLDLPPASAPAPQAAETVAADTVVSETAVQFVAHRKADIPSDNALHRVGLADSSYKTELLLVSVPRLAPAAYLEADVLYDGAQPLLAGPAQLFRDGEFVGSADLPAKAPGERFKLGFGQDTQVKVERKLLDRKSAPGGGILFAKGERRYQWRTTVTSFHASNRALELREQLPRSRQAQITVETLNTDPKPLPDDPAQPGLLRWRLDLAPKKEAKVDLGYRVKFPEDQTVTGLE